MRIEKTLAPIQQVAAGPAPRVGGTVRRTRGAGPAAKVLVLLGLAAPVIASDTGALIRQALDAPVTLELEAVPLDEALEAVADQTGVPLAIRPATYDLLPYGRFTPITLRAKGVTLQDAVDAVAQRLGLELVAAGDAAELRPLPALERLGRRATAQELALLGTLRRTPLPDAGGELSLADVMERVDLALLAVDTARPEGEPATNFHIEFRVTDDLVRAQPVRLPRGATLLEALEVSAGQTDTTFHPWGDGVLVLTDRELLAGRLDRPIDVRYDGSTIEQVLADLARRSGVRIAAEPGALRRLPAEARTLSLTLENASARQALDAISGYTGLLYVLAEEGVVVRGPDPTFAGDVIGLVRGEGGVWLPVREGDVSPEVAARLREQKAALIENLGDQ